jgi:ABC-type sugar transport system substrate-binding protein
MVRAARCAAALLAAALLLLASAAPAGQPFAPGVVLAITIENFDQEVRQSAKKQKRFFIRSRGTQR